MLNNLLQMHLKNPSKRVIQKTAESSLQNNSETVTNEEKIHRERYKSPEKRQQIINDLRLIQKHNKRISKNNKILSIIHQINPFKFRTKKWVETNDESRATYNISNQIKF